MSSPFKISRTLTFIAAQIAFIVGDTCGREYGKSCFVQIPKWHYPNDLSLAFADKDNWNNPMAKIKGYKGLFRRNPFNPFNSLPFFLFQQFHLIYLFI